MTDKDIKKLSRSDLLELLIEQKKENDQLKAKFADLDTDYEAKTEEINEKHAEEIAELKNEYEAKIVALKNEYEGKLARTKSECEAKVAGLKTDCEAKLAEVKTEYEGMFAEIKAEYEAAPAKTEIEYEEIGTLAEAVMKVNGVFEAADAAAKQYLDTIILNNDAQARKAEQIVAEAEEKARLIVARAELESKNTRVKADEYWTEVSERLEKFYDEHKGLRELIKLPIED